MYLKAKFFEKKPRANKRKGKLVNYDFFCDIRRLNMQTAQFIIEFTCLNFDSHFYCLEKSSSAIHNALDCVSFRDAIDRNKAVIKETRSIS